jgi:hypothetical protein
VQLITDLWLNKNARVMKIKMNFFKLFPIQEKPHLTATGKRNSQKHEADFRK